NGKVVNVSALKQIKRNQKSLETLPPDHKIVYEPAGELKGEIYVFTDVTCPYCVKLHNEIPELNNGGIRVTYITWPRGPFGTAPYTKAQRILCASDKKAVLEHVLAGAESDADASCQNSPVSELHALGQRLGVSGTPAIFFESGEMVGGYLPAREIFKK